KALEIVREGIATVEDTDLFKLPILEADLLREISPKQALNKLDGWIRENPTPEGLYLRSVIKHSQRLLDEARKDVDLGLKMAPDHRGLLLMKVTLLKLQIDYEPQALLDALRVAMIHAPDSPLLAFETGVTAYHLNKLDSARESFDRAFQIVGRVG